MIFQGKLYFINVILIRVCLTKSNVLIYYFYSRFYKYFVNGLRHCFCPTDQNTTDNTSDEDKQKDNLDDKRFKPKNDGKNDINVNKRLVVVKPNNSRTGTQESKTDGAKKNARKLKPSSTVGMELGAVGGTDDTVTTSRFSRNAGLRSYRL